MFDSLVCTVCGRSDFDVALECGSCRVLFCVFCAKEDTDARVCPRCGNTDLHAAELPEDD